MNPASFTFCIETLGCKANLSDSHLLAARLEALGGRASEDAPEVYILNSCTVTDRADRDALALLKKKRAKLSVLAGCLAEVQPEILQNISAENSLLLARNSGKQDLPQAIVDGLVRAGREKFSMAVVGDRSQWHQHVDHEPGMVARYNTRTRAFLKVQDGCNQFCSYCIIPHARGRSRSLTFRSVIDEVKEIVDNGTKELVLTAIHAGDYEDAGKDFYDLIERVLRETQIARVRLTSLDPAQIPERLLWLMREEPRLCAHLHVSLQSGSERILREMRRHYSAAQARDCLQRVYELLPQAFVGMDMIAGFPGETDAEHAETLTLLCESPWTRLHVFPFSPRRSTLAAKLETMGLRISDTVKHARALELRRLSEQRLQEMLAVRVGKIMELLTEMHPIFYNGERYTQGHSRSYFKIWVPKDLPANRLIRVRITGVGKRENLLGEVV